MKTIKITFDPNSGVICPDNQVIKIAEDILKNEKDISIGNSLILDAIRVVMVRKQINPKKVIVSFKNEIIEIDNLYNFSNYPDEFCDVEQKLLEELRKYRSKKNGN